MDPAREPDVARWVHIDERGVTVEVQGEISIAVLPRVLNALTSHPRFDASLPTLWDFSGSSGLGRFGRSDIASAIRAMSSLRRDADRPRVALVAPNDVDFGMLRMFEGLGADQVPIELGVFRDTAEARAWAFRAPPSSAPEPEGA